MSASPHGWVWKKAHPTSSFPTVGHALRPPAGREKSVVVIGAGMAGLHTAYLLARWGHEVTVLEAKDRPGGRIETIRGPFAGGQYAEAGAFSFPGHHNLSVGYCILFKLPMVVSDPDQDKIVYHLEGRRIDNPMAKNARWPYPLHRDEKGLGAMLAKYLLSKLDAVGDPRASGWPSRKLLRELDRVSVTEMMKRDGASDGAMTILSQGYLKETGDGPDSVSALSILQDVALSAGGRPSPRIPPGVGDKRFAGVASDVSFQVAGGNDLLPLAFAESPELRGRVLYEHAVTSIGESKTGVRVRCQTPEGHRSFRAGRVVVAIPFSVLRDRVRIALPLTRGKRRAIEELQSTAVTRVYVQTRSRPWTKDGIDIVNTDLPAMIVNDQTIGQRGERGILESLMAGPNARWADRLDPDELVRRIRKQLREMLPGINPIRGRHAIKSWQTDPWAQGDYCWYAPGQMAEILPHVAKAQPPIHFAGDHTSVLTSWAQGALESGLRAAQEVHRGR